MLADAVITIGSFRPLLLCPQLDPPTNMLHFSHQCGEPALHRVLHCLASEDAGDKNQKPAAGPATERGQEAPTKGQQGTQQDIHTGV